MSIFLRLLYLIPPGTLTVLMALGAGLIAVPTFDKWMETHRWARVAAIILFCGLAAGEIAILSEANRVGEAHYQYLVYRFDNSDKLGTANLAAQQRVAALSIVKPTAKPHIATATLKERAVRLSADILAFLTERQAGEPPSPRADTWNQDVQAELHYWNQTMSLYSQTFAAQVIATRNELASRGITDEELDRFYENPTNPIGIRIVAEHLGALAERLSN